MYELDDPIETKLAALARRIYGGTGVELSPAARATLESGSQLAGELALAERGGEDAASEPVDATAAAEGRARPTLLQLAI